MSTVDRDEFRDAMERMSGEMSRGFTRLEQGLGRLSTEMNEIGQTVAVHDAILNRPRTPPQDKSDALPQDRRKLTLWDGGLILGAIIATVAFLKFFGRL